MKDRRNEIWTNAAAEFEVMVFQIFWNILVPPTVQFDEQAYAMLTRECRSAEILHTQNFQSGNSYVASMAPFVQVFYNRLLSRTWFEHS